MNRKSKIVEIAGIGLIAAAVWTVLIMLSDASPAEGPMPCSLKAYLET